ncbi:MAG: DUF1963 domain-containing protein [Defluviitaleaceae bacterium]|nr:DUF1963 domain-containing protein [Defluviitaleaceae bacterium]
MSLAEKYINGLKEAHLQYGCKKTWKHFEKIKRGAKDKHIRKIKKLFPSVPDSLLQLLAYADGTYHRKYKGEKINLYFLGSDVEEYPYYLCSCKQIIESKDIATKGLSDYIDRAYEEDEVEVDEKIINSSAGAKWLLFSECMNNGGTSKLFIDFTPSGKGTVGQVVRYLHDPDELEVIADSFDEYLEMLIEKNYDFIHKDDDDEESDEEDSDTQSETNTVYFFGTDGEIENPSATFISEILLKDKSYWKKDKVPISIRYGEDNRTILYLTKNEEHGYLFGCFAPPKYNAMHMPFDPQKEKIRVAETWIFKTTIFVYSSCFVNYEEAMNIILSYADTGKVPRLETWRNFSDVIVTLQQLVAEFSETTKTLPSVVITPKLIDTSASDNQTGVVLTPARSNMGVFGNKSSKIGGNPYLPKNFDYPCDKEGNPLKLLAQLNFDELPKLPGFPYQGILQFFVRPDNMQGYNRDNLTLQDGFRVIYHQNVSSDEFKDFPQITDEFPINEVFALTGKFELCPLSTTDYRFNEAFMPLYNKHLSTNDETAKNFDDIDYDIADEIFKELSAKGTRMGGYPLFTQTDPRARNRDLQKYDTLLFQIDTKDECFHHIFWADGAMINFFINSKNLKACDFSDVMYTWDCY